MIEGSQETVEGLIKGFIVIIDNMNFYFSLWGVLVVPKKLSKDVLLEN